MESISYCIYTPYIPKRIILQMLHRKVKLKEMREIEREKGGLKRVRIKRPSQRSLVKYILQTRSHHAILLILTYVYYTDATEQHIKFVQPVLVLLYLYDRCIRALTL